MKRKISNSQVQHQRRMDMLKVSACLAAALVLMLCTNPMFVQYDEQSQRPHLTPTGRSIKQDITGTVQWVANQGKSAVQTWNAGDRNQKNPGVQPVFKPGVKATTSDGNITHCEKYSSKGKLLFEGILGEDMDCHPYQPKPTPKPKEAKCRKDFRQC